MATRGTKSTPRLAIVPPGPGTTLITNEMARKRLGTGLQVVPQQEGWEPVRGLSQTSATGPGTPPAGAGKMQTKR